MAKLGLVAVGILILFSIYIIARSLGTRSSNLGLAPVHIQYAPSLLKWITKVALFLTTLSICFESDDQLWFAGIDGSFAVGDIAIMLISAFVLIGVGTSCALLTMLGIALIRIKEARFRRLSEPNTELLE
ncbi:hypothetical protein [Sphingopyxis sp. BSNA05]|uniref:hypothetical protein n=1 Tax=Sphingopyxis sp. BSNA05 TaxID=1236614 RepID=UPI001C25CF2E|nr:hypothetical protein [Sphingopyxis sp. BSNA05]